MQNQKFAKGDKVVQIIKPIEGEVVGFSFDETTGVVGVRVEYKDADGAVLERTFSQDEFEVAQVDVEKA